MIVSKEQLEAGIAVVRAGVRDPRGGVFGPSSLMWSIDREAALFAGAGRAALLQLAHPFVAHAIAKQSSTRVDPLGRFQRTFDNVYAMVFGDLESAVASARRVHAVHRHVHGVIDEDVGALRRGDRYDANDEDALMWVHATLVDSALLVYDALVRPLTDTERDRYYDETKRFARLFGISDAVLPPDGPAFRAYFAAMLASPAIAVGERARETARFLLTPRRPGYAPLARWTEVMTAALLPPRLRADFQLRWGARERAIHAASVRAFHAVYLRLPDVAREHPAYVAAKRRLGVPVASLEASAWVEHLVGSLLAQAPLRTIVKGPRRAPLPG
ncbi:MAG: DUF2236 domain-containing protein [Labilithrix sp.]|nr:DUF2236 domain-containing protein [Labilithrix sp.]MCW5811462.1 DUF2236 domain-containing protein [Labilithrix sp.]